MRFNPHGARSPVSSLSSVLRNEDGFSPAEAAVSVHATGGATNLMRPVAMEEGGAPVTTGGVAEVRGGGAEVWAKNGLGTSSRVDDEVRSGRG